MGAAFSLLGDQAPRLPAGWVARTPELSDVSAITEIGTAHRQQVRGQGAFVDELTMAEVIGHGAWMRRQVVAELAGTVWAWAMVHDRAAGRTIVQLIVAPDAPQRDAVATALLNWMADAGADVGRFRGVHTTQLDALLDTADRESATWHRRAGYRHTRTWLNMKRRIGPGDAEVGSPRDGVEVRRVAVHHLEDGTTLPVAEDLQAVHRVLEESFADHFNSYRESFSEFAQRLREDPGHRWDHWWLALVEVEGELVAGGAIVCSAAPDMSYIEYIGVHRRARGLGVAKALLAAVFADAYERGRGFVGLEVDADSPTGADGLYRSLGFESSYETRSWQRDVETGFVDER